MNFKLGINTGFAINRYPEPEIWTQIIAEELGLKHIQFTADLLNPSLPSKIISLQTKKILKAIKKYNLKISSTFTGAFTRVNHLAHPDAELRKYWLEWFKKYVDISADLGAESMGSHLGIFTAKDNNDKALRKERKKQNIEGWHKIADYSKANGLKYLTWEPMSISREQGETLKEAKSLHEEINKNSPLPFFICLDVDHGDIMSDNPDDTNPYCWLKEFAHCSPLVHLKQSSENKSGHWPFTNKYNEKGRIVPEKVINTLSQNGRNTFDKTILLLELSFREREPIDSTVIQVLKESVDFWRPHVSI